MPQDPLLWTIAIVVGGVVVIVALALGGIVEVGLDPLRLSFRRKKDAGRESVSVLDQAEIEDAEIGSVTGVAREPGSAAEGGRVSDIDVARKAKIKGGKIGDISGVTIAGKKDDPAP
ncbi:MAG: hypothetical protein RH942_00775 [Kiloniellaceae bacterium]